MNRLQRLFFLKREARAEAKAVFSRLFEGVSEEQVMARLGGLSGEQRALPLMVAQRLMDGLEEALARGRALSAEELMGIQGRLQALAEFADTWQELLTRADELGAGK